MSDNKKKSENNIDIDLSKIRTKAGKKPTVLNKSSGIVQLREGAGPGPGISCERFSKNDEKGKSTK